MFGPTLHDYWEAYRGQVLSMWIAGRPGTRPSLWWNVDAPRLVDVPERWRFPEVETVDVVEPRQRLGGIGTAECDVYYGPPSFHCGIPDLWIEAWEANDGTPVIDPTNPPLYESQAAHLRRHRLFLPGEEARLTEADFEPERVLPPPSLDEAA